MGAWRTGAPIILRSTSFSVTLGLMVFPGGAFVAKLAEHANRVPWRVAGMNSTPKQRILYALNMLEFAMLAVVACRPVFSEAMRGLPLLAAQILIVVRALGTMRI